MKFDGAGLHGLAILEMGYDTMSSDSVAEAPEYLEQRSK
jgi:hypothetical protein